MQLLCCHGVTEVRQKVAGVGVVDQHGHRADYHGQVHKVLPTETAADLGLVAGAAEHHRHVDGRVEQERPSLQGQRGGDEEEEREEEEGRPGGGMGMSPGEGHVGSLLPAQESEGGMGIQKRATVKHTSFFTYDILDIIHNLLFCLSLSDPFV